MATRPFQNPQWEATAGNVEVDPSGLLVVTGTNVQAALAELDAEVGNGAYALAEQAGITPVSGRYHLMPGVNDTTTTLLVDRVYTYPLFLSGDSTLDRAGVGITGAGDGSAVVRLGIAQWNGGDPNGAPLVGGAELGTVDGTSATNQELTALAQSLPKGAYWLCVLTNGETSTAPTLDAYTPTMCPVHSNSLTAAVDNGIGALVSGVSETGSIPDPLPSTLNGASVPVPKIALRFS